MNPKFPEFWVKSPVTTDGFHVYNLNLSPLSHHPQIPLVSITILVYMNSKVEKFLFMLTSCNHVRRYKACMEKHVFLFGIWSGSYFFSVKSERYFNPSHYSGVSGTVTNFCGRIYQLIQFFVRNSLFIWDTSKQKIPLVNSVSREMTYYLTETCHTLKLFFRLSKQRKTWKGLLCHDTDSLATLLHKE